jgi:hypothetical protein
MTSRGRCETLPMRSLCSAIFIEAATTARSPRRSHGSLRDARPCRYCDLAHRRTGTSKRHPIDRLARRADVPRSDRFAISLTARRRSTAG